MIGIPQEREAAEYYFRYIRRVDDADILGVLDRQANEVPVFLRGISEEKSLYRYATGKWSIRQLWSHVNDAERIFVSRALWFARGLDTPLPSFDQEIAVSAAKADAIPWSNHLNEFEHVRAATVDFFRNLPAESWTRKGMASGNPITVRALAYIVAGHVAHHEAILRERYF